MRNFPEPALLEQAWDTYFRDDFICRKHDFRDENGGICPSCARYAFNQVAYLHVNIGNMDETTD